MAASLLLAAAVCLGSAAATGAAAPPGTCMRRREPWRPAPAVCAIPPELVHLGQGQQWGGRTKGNNQQLQQQQQQQQQASDAGVQLGFCAVTGDAAGDAAGAAAGARYIVRFNAYSAADDLRRQLQQ
ncbi:hypothetical protein MNEG_15647, partial [Monoraphidium neglectum]